MKNLLKHTKRHCQIILTALIAVCVLSNPAAAQTSAFTYQGKLTDGGNPASGVYDLQFRLFDALAGGNQVGSTIIGDDVTVTGGIFTVTLDFGAAAFPGANRWLEIGVRPGVSTGAFTLLSPRQPLTSTPYAVQSLNATSAANALQLGGVAANQYVVTSDARLTDARPPTAGSADYIQNNPASQQAGNFNISGNGTAGGTLSANIVNSTTQYNLGGSRVLSAAGTRNIFAGIGAGQSNTLGTDNAFFGFNAGLNNTGNLTIGGRFNSFFGANAGQLLTQGRSNSFFGANAGGASTTGNNNSFFGVNAGSGNSGDDNAFFGNGAGAQNTASGSSFFGSGAGNANTTGSGNSFFGYQAGQQNTSSYNSFFGYQAGGNNVGGTNAFFGYSAGLSNTSGGNNTVIGFLADVGSGNLFNATAIGAEVVVNASDTLVLGSSGVNTPTANTNVVIGATGSGSIGFINSRAARLNVYGGPPWTSFSWKSALQIENAAAIGWDNDDSGRSFGIGRSIGGLYFFRSLSPMGNTSSLALYDLQIDDAGLARFYRNCVANAAGSAIAGTCSSDARLKRDITPFPRLLEKVAQLRPVHFYWRREEFPARAFGSEQSFGLIAQEAEKVLPELVGADADGYKTVNYTKLPLLLLQAVKDLKAENDALKQQHAAAEARLAALEQTLRQLMEQTQKPPQPKRP